MAEGRRVGERDGCWRRRRGGKELKLNEDLEGAADRVASRVFPFVDSWGSAFRLGRKSLGFSFVERRGDNITLLVLLRRLAEKRRVLPLFLNARRERYYALNRSTSLHRMVSR